MTSYEYWAKLVAERPELADESARVYYTVADIHVLMILSHRAGYEYGKEVARDDGLFPGLFDSILKGGG